MGIISSMRRQKATWWHCTGTDGYNQPAFAAPVTIDCRWEDTQKKFVTNGGEEKISMSVVYVDRVLEIGDYLRLGIHAGTDPRSDRDAHAIESFSKLPNLRQTETLYTAIF